MTIILERATTLTSMRSENRGGEIRAFFRDPDGHLFEMSQVTA